MNKAEIPALIDLLSDKNVEKMYQNDFFLTWQKSYDEIRATFLVADILRGMRENNISTRLFDSGLGISLFRDNSTRTRFSYAVHVICLDLKYRTLMKKNLR